MKLLELYYYQEVGQRIIDFGLASAQEVANFTRNDMQQFQTELSVYEDMPSPPSQNINLNDYVTFIHEINQAVILEKEVLLNVKWGQRAPFNLHAEVMNNGERAPAGCVAIAVGQITTYHKYPKVLERKTLNWDILSQATAGDFDTEEEQFEIASYIRKIGDYLGNMWTANGTHATLNFVPNALSRLGYTRGIISDYSRGLVEESLSAKLPLFIGGQSTGGGHAWVIDGYLKTSYDVLVYNNEMGELVWTWTVHPSYYHCNWGANGRYNGFYKKDVFDLQHGMMYHDDGGQYYYNPQNPEHNFCFDIKIITDIKPKLMQIHEG